MFRLLTPHYVFTGEGCVAISLWLIQSVVIFGKTPYFAFIYPNKHFSCHSYDEASKIQDSDQLLLANFSLSQVRKCHDVGFSDLVSGNFIDQFQLKMFYHDKLTAAKASQGSSSVSFASTALI